MLKVALPETCAPNETPEAIVDDDIAKFNDWFVSLGNDPVVRAERAIIKTYLAWKLGLAKPGSPTAEPPGPEAPPETAG